MATALVFSAGGTFAAWEAGVWRVLHTRVRPDVIVGASAGAWNAWMIAGGAAPEELVREWLDPAAGALLRFGLHRAGFLRPDGLHRKARELAQRYRPRVPFGLALVEWPRMRPRVVRDAEIDWRHLVATCSIPFCFPPVKIGGRRYVDGGWRGALPLWAAEAMGAERAVAIDAWTRVPLHWMHRLVSPRTSLEVVRIEPSERLGPARDSLRWNEADLRRWIALGERDATRAVTSITM